MKVIVEVEVENCVDCPYHKYEGVVQEEELWICMKTDSEIDTLGINEDCPYIEKTIEKPTPLKE